MFAFVFLIVMALIVFVIVRWLFQSSGMFVGGYDKPVDNDWFFDGLVPADRIAYDNKEFDRIIKRNYSPTERVEINLYDRQMSVLY